MKQMIHSLILFSCFFASVLSMPGQGSPLVRKTDRENQKEQCEAYLKSYDDAKLTVDSKSIFYSSSVSFNTLSRIDNLSEGETEENGNVTFDVTYMAMLNRAFITATLRDAQGETADTVFVTGESYFNADTENIEIIYDFNGNRFLASDFVDPSDVSPISLVNVDPITIGGSSVTFPVIQITLSVANLDDAQNGVPITMDCSPDFNGTAGPLLYTFYQAKLKMVAEEYALNSQFDNPTTYINNQGDVDPWKAWRYGFSNMNAAGCEIFAMFNFFISQGKVPHLASLIAYTQILNADSLFGLFGTNTFPETSRFYNTINYLTIIMFDILTPFIQDVIGEIAGEIANHYIESQSIWVKTVLWVLYPAVYGVTLAAVETEILADIFCANTVAQVYGLYCHTIADVIKYFGNVTNTQVKHVYSDFASYTETNTQYGSYIISYWNRLKPDSSEPYIFGQIHTIFIRKPSTSSPTLTAYNYGMLGGTTSRSSLDLFMDSSLSNAASKFIQGIALKA